MPRCIEDKTHLGPILPELRALFAAVKLDITAYDDDALMDAVLAVCPVVDAGWPTDDDLKRIFQHLRTRPRRRFAV